MGKLQKLVLIAMVIISFTNLFGLPAAGISNILGVIFFFVAKAAEKRPFAGSGLDITALGQNLKERSIWFWLVMPIVMDGVSIMLARLFLPEYIDHVVARAGIFVSYDAPILLLLLQLIFLALGEEIAWRAFFQKELCKVLPLTPVLLISSVLFGIGHLVSGNLAVVVFDVFFVFVNSILYGIIFHKTQNAWASGLSHFAANLFSIIVLVLL